MVKSSCKKLGVTSLAKLLNIGLEGIVSLNGTVKISTKGIHPNVLEIQYTGPVKISGKKDSGIQITTGQIRTYLMPYSTNELKTMRRTGSGSGLEGAIPVNFDIIYSTKDGVVKFQNPQDISYRPTKY